MKRKINCIMFDLPTSKGAASLVGRGPPVASVSVRSYQKVYLIGYYRYFGYHRLLFGALPLGYRRCWCVGRDLGMCIQCIREDQSLLAKMQRQMHQEKDARLSSGHSRRMVAHQDDFNYLDRIKQAVGDITMPWK